MPGTILTVETVLNAEIEDHLGYQKITQMSGTLVTAVMNLHPKPLKELLAACRWKRRGIEIFDFFKGVQVKA